VTLRRSGLLLAGLSLAGLSLAGLLLAALLPMLTAASADPRLVAAATRPTPIGVAEPLVQSVEIGTSVLGRPIVAVHRWRPGATHTLLVIGNMHGDEQAGLRVVHRLLTHSLPAAVDLWLIRSANPDGTAADRRTNADGVDLNRNFPQRWVRAGEGTSNWSGPSAASEPETQALLSFVARIQPRTTVVFHQPLDGVDAYRAKSITLVRRLARASGLPVRSFDCHGGCHGTFTDWLNTRTAGRAVTVEFAAHASRARVVRMKKAVLTVAVPPKG
jgi:protein MpaA